jgi:uncharacterized membrane protein
MSKSVKPQSDFYSAGRALELVGHYCDQLASQIMIRIARSMPDSNSLCPAQAEASQPERYRFLVISIGLNVVLLAFILAFRTPIPSHRGADIFGLIYHLSATMPPADADTLRTLIDVNRSTIVDSQNEFHAAQIQVLETLGHEPFDKSAMRAAMARSRVARDHYDEAIHDIFANAVAQISNAGRRALADWSINHRYARTTQATRLRSDFQAN